MNTMSHLEPFCLRGMVHIQNPVIVERYNQCLEAIGKSKTSLREFHIDALGWSPEIAEEMGDEEYLSQTVANPYGIIVAVEQEEAPVLMPFHSFDKQLVKHIWETVGRNLASLVSRTGVFFEIDQRITRYRSPEDLRMIDFIEIEPNSVGNIMTGVREQRDLVSKLHEGDNWMNSELRDRIRQNGKEFGDLRFSPIVVPKITFTNVRSFYARAFGGVFIFRDLPKREDSLMILRDSKFYDSDRKNVLCLEDHESVLTKMVKEGMYDFSLDESDIDRLRYLRRTLFAESVYSYDPNYNMVQSTSGSRQAFINCHIGLFPEYFFELEFVINALRSGNVIKKSQVSDELKRILYKPSITSYENPSLYELLMFLLSELVLVSVQDLLNYNKQLFSKHFASWSEPRRMWALQQLKEHTK